MSQSDTITLEDLNAVISDDLKKGVLSKGFNETHLDALVECINNVHLSDTSVSVTRQNIIDLLYADMLNVLAIDKASISIFDALLQVEESKEPNQGFIDGVHPYTFLGSFAGGAVGAVAGTAVGAFVGACAFLLFSFSDKTAVFPTIGLVVGVLAGSLLGASYAIESVKKDSKKQKENSADMNEVLHKIVSEKIEPSIGKAFPIRLRSKMAKVPSAKAMAHSL